MTDDAQRARKRALWALLALVLVNAVVLWCYLGVSASLVWQSRLLDEDSLRSCAVEAATGRTRYHVPHPDATFVADATVEFDAVEIDDSGESQDPVRVRCSMAPSSGDADVDDPLVVVAVEVPE